MKYKIISLIFGVGWALTLALFAYLFFVGDVQPVAADAVDRRVTINLTKSEKNLVLGEMRLILAALQGVLENLSREEYENAATIASGAGMKMATEVGGEHPSVLRKLPFAMRKLGFSVHRDFDDLSRTLKQPEVNRQEVLSNLSNTLSKCVSCHATYRLK